EVRATKEILGFDPDESFVVPDEVRAHMAGVVERGQAAQRAWQERFDAWREAFPDVYREWQLDRVPEPRAGWRDAMPSFPAGEDLATRDAGRKVMAALRPYTPTMIGGGADLVESTRTEFAGSGVFSKTHAGRNIAFGIREHAMGSIVN